MVVHMIIGIFFIAPPPFRSSKQKNLPVLDLQCGCNFMGRRFVPPSFSSLLSWTPPRPVVPFFPHPVSVTPRLLPCPQQEVSRFQNFRLFPDRRESADPESPSSSTKVTPWHTLHTLDFFPPRLYGIIHGLAAKVLGKYGQASSTQPGTDC